MAKKIIAIVFGAVIVFALGFFCGKSGIFEKSDKTENTEVAEQTEEKETFETETVELTMDNYSDYLEVVPVAYWWKNDFGEMDYVVINDELCVKPDYAGKIVFDDNEIIFEWNCGYFYMSGDYDIKNARISNYKWEYQPEDWVKTKSTGKITAETYEHILKTSESEIVSPLKDAYEPLTTESDGITNEVDNNTFENSLLVGAKKDITRISGTIKIKK